MYNRETLVCINEKVSNCANNLKCVNTLKIFSQGISDRAIYFCGLFLIEHKVFKILVPIVYKIISNVIERLTLSNFALLCPKLFRVKNQLSFDQNKIIFLLYLGVCFFRPFHSIFTRTWQNDYFHVPGISFFCTWQKVRPSERTKHVFEPIKFFR